LNERYLAGEGAEHADMLRALFAFPDPRTPSDLRARLLDPAFQTTDHRSAYFGQGNRDGALNYAETVLATSSGAYSRFLAIHAIAEDRVLTDFLVGGLVDEAVFETRFLVILTMKSGAFTAMELFEESALDEARARFDELERENANSRQ